ncbi:hypothetical protein SNE40_015924 [Patella caerulea]|uniref:Uncharacterized protein n=1 Tax=Patella caerulea TaxID=87958 RepID=A0AAN8PHQ9_PATCE
MLAFKVLMCSLLVIASILSMTSATTCTDTQLSSSGYRYNSKVIIGATRILTMDVRRKLSQSSCNSGYSYGHNGNTIWVNHGCRAIFTICYEGISATVSCSSNKFQPATCPISTGGKHIVGLELKQQISSSPCVLDESFYLIGNAIRVIDGCRGLFRVKFANY